MSGHASASSGTWCPEQAQQNIWKDTCNLWGGVLLSITWLMTIKTYFWTHVCQTSKSHEVPLVGLITGPKCYLHFMIFPKGFPMRFSWKCRGISVCWHRNLYFFTRKHRNCMQLQLQFANVFSAHLKNGPSLFPALGKTSLPDGFTCFLCLIFQNPLAIWWGRISTFAICLLTFSTVQACGQTGFWKVRWQLLCAEAKI